jgi:hypothetical protein
MASPGSQSQGAIIYTVIGPRSGVSAFNGPARPDVADMAAKVLQQVDLSVNTKKSYSSKGCGHLRYGACARAPMPSAAPVAHSLILTA